MEGRGRELNATLVDVLDARVRACRAVGSPDRINSCSCTCAGGPRCVRIARTVVRRTSPLTDTNRPAKNSVEVPLAPKTVGLCETSRPARNSNAFLATNFPAKNSSEFILWEPGANIKPPAKYSIDSIQLVVTICLDEGLSGVPALETSLPPRNSMGSLCWL